MAIRIRQSHDRGYFKYEWLKTYHTFSFGRYADPQHMGFRSLLVINENRVQPGVGFPLHTNQDMEIFSLVLEGGLAHQDNMGNGAVLRPGHMQLINAGTGVTYSEYNSSDKETVHFLQVWILPDTKKLEPSYQETFFSEEAKRNQWCLILSQTGENHSLKIHQNIKGYLTRLEVGKSLSYELGDNRQGWLQVIEGSILLNEQPLDQGDGAAISQEPYLNIQAQTAAYLLFFDLN